MDEQHFTQRIVELANANGDLDAAGIEQIITDNDVVYGVWQDPTAPHSVGTLIIKGINRVRDIVATGTAADLKLSAIRCPSVEHAEAIRQVCGDPGDH
jgi:hypothetical protein